MWIGPIYTAPIFTVYIRISCISRNIPSKKIRRFHDPLFFIMASPWLMTRKTVLYWNWGQGGSVFCAVHKGFIWIYIYTHTYIYTYICVQYIISNTLNVLVSCVCYDGFIVSWWIHANSLSIHTNIQTDVLQQDLVKSQRRKIPL